ncbi:MAG: hypothetical protein K0M40_08140 [Prolixibacteraceae bacterium]|nr:hypothetical protein [Prolixibacteraceae bacterium]
MRLTILIVISLVTQLIYGQEKSDLIGLRLKLHPFMLLNPDKPYIQGSTEIIVKNKIGLEIGFGKRYIDDWLLDGILTDKEPDSAVVDFKGTSFMGEIKYYGLISKISTNYSDYIGITYRWVDDLRNKRLEYYPYDRGNTINLGNDLIEENCAIQRGLNILAIKYGGILEYNKFGFEGFIELGIKHKHQYYIANELYEAGYDAFSDFHNPTPKPMNRYRPHLGIGFRISYKIL